MKTTLKTQNKSKNSKTVRMSIANSTELHKLKRTINDSAEAVESLVKSVKDKSRQALAEALVCGGALLKAKFILGFGQFEKWCRENCKKVSEKTARNYMRLAKGQSVADLLATGGGLKEAYISIGILKEDDSAPSETQGENGSSHAGIADDGAVRANGRANGSSKTPLADTLAHASGRNVIVSAKPTINKNDAMSRIRHLVNECVIDINNKLSTGLINRADLKAELKPLAEFVR